MPKIDNGHAKVEKLYPRIEVNGVEIPREALRIDEAKMEALLNWETKKDYEARTGSLLGWTTLFTDENGDEVMCWNNSDNRPFREKGARAYAQDLLTRNFHFNGETIIISESGKDHSGQHRLIGGKLACQIWRKDPRKWPLWDEPPYLESLVVFGISDDPKVVRTLDNVIPRDETDAIYTSDLYRSLTPAARKECSRMLANAVGLLWDRTGAKGYRTHSEAAEFRARHPRLLQANKHLFEENKERSISKLRLSAGKSAALLYLMATGWSDAAAYRASEPPSEDHLDLDAKARGELSAWDLAEEFWVTLASSTADASANGGKGKYSGDLGLARLAIAKLPEGGTERERFAILAQAWDAFKVGKKLTPADVDISAEYETTPDGQVFKGHPTFGGIDLGEEGEPVPEEGQVALTKEQVRAENARLLKERAEALKNGKDKPQGPAEVAIKPSLSLDEELDAIKDAAGGRVCLIKRVGGWRAWREDAQRLGQLCKATVRMDPGLKMSWAELPDAEAEAGAAKLQAAGHPVAWCDKREGKVTIHDEMPKPKTKAPAAKKAEGGEAPPAAKPAPKKAAVKK